MFCWFLINIKMHIFNNNHFMKHWKLSYDFVLLLLCLMQSTHYYQWAISQFMRGSRIFRILKFCFNETMKEKAKKSAAFNAIILVHNITGLTLLALLIRVSSTSAEFDLTRFDMQGTTYAINKLFYSFIVIISSI